MEFELLYWHWIVFGIGLMMLEIFIPSFTILWFGAGAVVVGAVLFVFPEVSLAFQVFIWAMSSCIFTALWFKLLKPKPIDEGMVALSLESIQGEVGQVLVIPSEQRQGTLRFPAPILGLGQWSFICEEPVAIGDRVRVTDISGNTLIVVKH